MPRWSPTRAAATAAAAVCLVGIPAVALATTGVDRAQARFGVIVGVVAGLAAAVAFLAQASRRS